VLSFVAGTVGRQRQTLGNCLLVGRNELQGGKILVDILGDKNK